MTNLLKETKSAIKDSGHKIKDIIFIGSEDTGHSCSWEDFQVLANKEYSNGFGAQEVVTDLIIVFSDETKLWRGEYDGSEWWEYSTPFKHPKNKKEIKTLFATDVNMIGWRSFESIAFELSKCTKDL